MTGAKLAIVVLISGNGSNLQAIIDAGLPVDIRAVISDKSDAYGLQRAMRAGIPTEVVLSRDYDGRQAYDEGLLKVLRRYQPELIVCAGFMRILGANVVDAYEGRIINIHPSLLPKYPGLNTHARVLQSKDHEHGVSIHLVNQELDAGPLLAQAAFKVCPEDTPESLAQKAHELEHQMYPQLLRLLSSNRGVDITNTMKRSLT